MGSRLHLFEWEDQPWLPKALRDFITDHLRYTFSAPQMAGLCDTIASILEGPLQRSKTSRIVDVCSGGGGPLPAVLPLLSQRLGRPFTATLTDLFPNAVAFARIADDSGGAVHGFLSPVSAFDVPAELGSFQTVFTAFHHFRPPEARRILADAVRKRRTIAVIEPFRRSNAVRMAIISTAVGFLHTPAVAPMSLKRFLLTYVLPVAPFVLAWDGVVSCLRAYSVEELEDLARETAPDYRWTCGARPIPDSKDGLVITYLIGEPPGS